jgi:hypothetical protein
MLNCETDSRSLRANDFSLDICASISRLTLFGTDFGLPHSTHGQLPPTSVVIAGKLGKSPLHRICGRQLEVEVGTSVSSILDVSKISARLTSAWLVDMRHDVKVLSRPSTVLHPASQMCHYNATTIFAKSVIYSSLLVICPILPSRHGFLF